MSRRIIINKVVGDTNDLTVRFNGLILGVYNSIDMKITKPDGVTKISRTVTPDVSDDEVGTVTFQSGDLVEGRSTAEFLFDVDGAGEEFTLPGKYELWIDTRDNNQ